MPQLINRDAQTAEKKPDTRAAAPKPSRSRTAPREISVQMVVAAGVVAFALILFLIHTYIHPFTSQVRIPHKVAPLPGMADQYPYNTKEWQDAYKAGRTTMLSGVPQFARGPKGSGQTAPPSLPGRP